MRIFIISSSFLGLLIAIAALIRVKSNEKITDFIYIRIRRLFFTVFLWVAIVLLQMLLPFSKLTFFLHELKYLPIFFTVLFNCDFLFSIIHVSASFRQVSWRFQLVCMSFGMILIATNPYHHIFRKSLEYVDIYKLRIVVAHNNWGFQLLTGYLYLLFSLYVLAILFTVVNVSKLYQRQYVYLFLASLLPLSLSMAFQYGLLTYLVIDLTPFSFFITTYIYLIVAKRMDLLIMTPLKHINVTQYIMSPIFITNRYDEVVDANECGLKLFQISGEKIIGMKFEILLASKKWSLDNLIQHSNKNYFRINAYKMLNDDESLLGTTYSFVDATKEVEYIKELEYLTLHDTLTTAYNKNFLNQYKNVFFSENNVPIGVIFGDLNGLKKINDSLGHDAGDKAIIETVESLLKVMDNKDCLIRLGGDEFIILKANATSLVLEASISRFEATIKSTSTFGLTISFGYALYDDLTSDIKEAYNKADMNMYENKKIYYSHKNMHGLK